jgi:hypothetical protein
MQNMIGLTIMEITGLEKGGDAVTFKTKEGRMFLMKHDQDCCESVAIEDIAGDIQNLLYVPLTMAEESSSETNPEGVKIEYQDSFTWTFYKLATVNGYITIRWYGSSNGYYSERVNFMEIT